MATNPPLRAPLQRPTTYDIAQEQLRHNDAIHWFGEMTCFLMWWRIEDFLDNLVERCSVCYVPFGDISEAFRQPSINKCVNCFGTTFEGGLRSVLYRPAIWELNPQSKDVVQRGEVEIIKGFIETLSNLDLREGDVAARRDGTRWQMDQPGWQEITTGFGSQKGQSSLRLRGRSGITLEDPTAVAYMPAVNLDALNLNGWLPYVPHSPHPLDFVPLSPVMGTSHPASVAVQIGPP